MECYEYEGFRGLVRNNDRWNMLSVREGDDKSERGNLALLQLSLYFLPVQNM